MINLYVLEQPTIEVVMRLMEYRHDLIGAFEPVVARPATPPTRRWGQGNAAQ